MIWGKMKNSIRHFQKQDTKTYTPVCEWKPKKIWCTCTYPKEAPEVMNEFPIDRSLAGNFLPSRLSRDGKKSPIVRVIYGTFI